MTRKQMRKQKQKNAQKHHQANDDGKPDFDAPVKKMTYSELRKSMSQESSEDAVAKEAWRKAFVAEVKANQTHLTKKKESL